MSRSLLLAVLVASTSLGCALENGAPDGDGPVAGDEQSLLTGVTGGLDLVKDPAINVRQRFDFVLTEDDSRTCDSFNRVAKGGTWRAFSTFPDAPLEIRTKRCAAVFTPDVAGGRATVDQLGLNCREGLTARERSCSNYGNKCPSAAYTVMRLPSSTSVSAKEIRSACPNVQPPVGVAPGEMYALTYTGGCTSCGTISNGLLYLNSPNPYGHVTYNVGGSPYMVSFNGLTGPITYSLGSGASGPVMVSY